VEIHDVAATPLGVLLAAGECVVSESNTDAVLLILDSSGVVAETVTLGDSSLDAATAVMPASDTSFIVAAKGAQSISADESDEVRYHFWLMEVAVSGELVRHVRVDLEEEETPMAMARMPAGGYAVGTSKSVRLFSSELSPAGDTAVAEAVMSIYVDSVNTIHCAGPKSNNAMYGGGRQDGLWICRMDETLNTTFSKALAYFDGNTGYKNLSAPRFSMVWPGQGYVCVGGNDVVYRMNESETGVLVVRENGSVRHYWLYESGGYDIAGHAAACADTTLLLGCGAGSYSAATGGLVRKIDANGTLYWEARVPGMKSAPKVRPLPDEGFLAWRGNVIHRFEADSWQAGIRERMQGNPVAEALGAGSRHSMKMYRMDGREISAGSARNGAGATGIVILGGAGVSKIPARPMVLLQ
jgi:hypothetical protein